MKCDGCKDFEACSFIVMGSVAINECPCGNCLIKGICHNPCDDLMQHYENVCVAHNIKPLIKKVKK